MKAPETPPDEAARLAALRSLGVLDTEPEERFDRFTRIARRLFGVPIALVSLVDEDRQWFKSRQGIVATETPRSVSFCGHAILQEAPFVVPDAAADERFADNPLVLEEPKIRFYAGIPLRTDEGRAMGTLCLIDRRPREFDPEQMELLKDFANMVEHEFSVQKLVTTDELTGISNRRGFLAIARHAVSVCRRMGSPATLLFLDMDGFKTINDTLGHEAGDTALVDFSRLLITTFREVDLVARLGGDEFCVLCTGDEKGIMEVPLNRLQELVEHHNGNGGRPFRLAYSVGSVAFDPDRHAGVQDLLAEADRAMYEVKRTRKAGR